MSAAHFATEGAQQRGPFTCLWHRKTDIPGTLASAHSGMSGLDSSLQTTCGWSVFHFCSVGHPHSVSVTNTHGTHAPGPEISRDLTIFPVIATVFTKAVENQNGWFPRVKGTEDGAVS